MKGYGLLYNFSAASMSTTLCDYCIHFFINWQENPPLIPVFLSKAENHHYLGNKYGKIASYVSGSSAAFGRCENIPLLVLI